MARYGQNGETLANYSALFGTHEQALQSLMGELDAMLGATQWAGSTRDRLADAWAGDLRLAIEELAGHLRASQLDCQARSTHYDPQTIEAQRQITVYRLADVPADTQTATANAELIHAR